MQPPESGFATFSPDEGVEVARSMLPEREQSAQLYALEVQGDSMIDAMVDDGDIVVMKPAQEARNYRGDSERRTPEGEREHLRPRHLIHERGKAREEREEIERTDEHGAMEGCARARSMCQPLEDGDTQRRPRIIAQLFLAAPELLLARF